MRIPKTEDGPPVTVRTENNEYFISWNKTAMKFTLWKVHRDNKKIDYEKITTTTSSPLKLYDNIDKIEKSNNVDS